MAKIHNRNHSNKEPRASRRGWYIEYEDRTCPDCGHVVTSPAGLRWACSWCETFPPEHEGTEASPTISGGEIYSPTSVNSREIPF